MSTSDLEHIIERLDRFHRTRHFGKYRGLVRDVADPDGLGRIRAEVPAVYDDQLVALGHARPALRRSAAWPGPDPRSR